jgi:hypothetical protein
MKFLSIVLALAACEKKSDPPAPPPPKPPLELVRCAAAPAPPAISYGGGGGVGIGGFGGRVTTPAPTLKKPRIEMHDTHAIGAFETAIVSRHVKQSFDDVLHCYDTTITTKATGTVAISLEIGADGKVSDSHATGMDDKLDDCVAQVMRGLAFDTPKDGGRTKARGRLTFTYVAPTGFSAGGRPIAFVDHKRTKKILDTPETRAPIDRALSQLTTTPNNDLPAQWTPFARHVPNSEAPDVDAAVATAMKAKLASLEHCFGDVKGSARAVIAVGATASDTHVRVGGLGDGKVEQCLGDAIGAIGFAPAVTPHEVACDLSRGGAQPWRVSAAGYATDKDHIALVSIGRDAPASAIAAALDAAAAAPVALVSIGGELVAVSPAHDWMSRGSLELSVVGGKLHACLRGIALDGSPALSDAAAVTAAIANAEKEWCHAACGIEVVGEVGGADLAALAAAARGAGIAPIGISAGSAETQCEP